MQTPLDANHELRPLPLKAEGDGSAVPAVGGSALRIQFASAAGARASEAVATTALLAFPFGEAIHAVDVDRGHQHRRTFGPLSRRSTPGSRRIADDNSDDADAGDDHTSSRGQRMSREGRRRRRQSPTGFEPASASRSGAPSGNRLYTAYLTGERDDGWMQAFAAVVAPSPTFVWESLCDRYGREAAAAAEIFEGFDASLPLAEALLSSAMADMLRQVASAPSSPLAAGLDVRIEQRFVA